MIEYAKISKMLEFQRKKYWPLNKFALNTKYFNNNRFKDILRILLNKGPVKSPYIKSDINIPLEVFRMGTRGFNRRFSESFVKIKKFFNDVKEPLIINYRVNAGLIPKTHWTQSPEQGGRLIGEGCHFIDTMQYLTGAKPEGVYAHNIGTNNSKMTGYDNTAIVINFSDGSVGNLLYIANGDSSVPKEYCEVYGGGRTAIMDNFKEVKMYSGGKMKKVKLDGKKGHKEEVEYFIKVLKGKQKPDLKFESIYLTTLATFRIMESLKTRKYIKI